MLRVATTASTASEREQILRARVQDRDVRLEQRRSVADGPAESVLTLGSGPAASIVPVELRAQELHAHFGGAVRLVVLECCEGARRGDFASAGELLIRGSADAVLTHRTEVRATVAAACSTARSGTVVSRGRTK